jgi:hypothetical protein
MFSQDFTDLYIEILCKDDKFFCSKNVVENFTLYKDLVDDLGKQSSFSLEMFNKSTVQETLKYYFQRICYDHDHEEVECNVKYPDLSLYEYLEVIKLSRYLGFEKLEYLFIYLVENFLKLMSIGKDIFYHYWCEVISPKGLTSHKYIHDETPILNDIMYNFENIFPKVVDFYKEFSKPIVEELNNKIFDFRKIYADYNEGCKDDHYKAYYLLQARYYVINKWIHDKYPDKYHKFNLADIISKDYGGNINWENIIAHDIINTNVKYIVD